MNNILAAWIISSFIITIIYSIVGCLIIYSFRKKLHKAALEYDALMWCLEEILESQGRKVIRVIDLPPQQLASDGRIVVVDGIIGHTVQVFRVSGIRLDEEWGLMVVEDLQFDVEEEMPKGWDPEKEDCLREGARAEVDRNGIGAETGEGLK